MYPKFPHLPAAPDDPQAEEARLRRVDWHGLLSRLQAEQDLRSAMDGETDRHGVAMLLAEGSFDPRAAEMLFSLAAGMAVDGDVPERRFSPDDISQFSQGPGHVPRLPNAKPSDCMDRPDKTATSARRNQGDPATDTSEEGNVSRT